MARPTKDPADALTYRLNARLTATEGQQLEQDAAAAGLTLSDHVARVLSVRAQPRQPKASPERAELIKALGPLGFIRSDMIHVRADINQLLKDRWAYKFVKPEQIAEALQRLDKAVADIEAIADHVHNQLEHDR